MVKRKKGYTPKPFESAMHITLKNGKSRGDTFANIYESMLLSSAWQDLSIRQRLLYLYCKSQYYSEKNYELKGKDNNPTIFTMNQYKWCKKYKLYSIGNKNQFYKDMDGLISHGFIKCLECGALARKKNVYAFSDKWQIWGNENFKIERSEMTYRMIKSIEPE